MRAHREAGQAAALLAVAMCLCVAGLQLVGRSSHRAVLGQDKDWHVHTWTPEHAIDVKASRVDATSVHNIWHSKKQAWAGIDRILPTGGRFGYEEYHNVNGNMAKLQNYMRHARNEIKTIEAHLPQADRGFKRKEEQKVKLTLDGERNGLTEIKHELNGETSVYDRSTPQMLAQVKPRAARKRVYADDALYGEGIVGDIKSQGHHERKWSRKGAAADMNAYYAKLNKKVWTHPAKSPTAQLHWKKRAGDEMDEYLDSLTARSAQKKQMHDKLLKQEGYYHTHPEEKLLKGK